MLETNMRDVLKPMICNSDPAQYTLFSISMSPGLKQPSFLSVIGLLILIGGEILRKTAMITASSNFNHYVQHIREEGHQLVTNGVYSIFRHPSYVGWFYWSIGTQVGC